MSSCWVSKTRNAIINSFGNRPIEITDRGFSTAGDHVVHPMTSRNIKVRLMLNRFCRLTL